MAAAVGKSDRPPGPAAPPSGVFVFAPGRFAAAAAELLAGRIRSTTTTPGTSLALAGGSTPRPVYEALSRVPGLPWERIEIFFSDERRVPAEDPASNFGMARSSLLRHVAVLPERVHRLRGEAEDPEAEARRYADALPDRLDLVVLGIGADGHTASLFPRHPALQERKRQVLAVEGPTEPRGRFTLAPPALAAAHRLLVFAAGPSKAEAVHQALAGAWEPDRCPAQLARRATWILDEGAAAQLDADLLRETDGFPVRGEPHDPAISA